MCAIGTHIAWFSIFTICATIFFPFFAVALPVVVVMAMCVCVCVYRHLPCRATREQGSKYTIEIEITSCLCCMARYVPTNSLRRSDTPANAALFAGCCRILIFDSTIFYFLLFFRWFDLPPSTFRIITTALCHKLMNQTRLIQYQNQNEKKWKNATCSRCRLLPYSSRIRPKMCERRGRERNKTKE